MSDHNYVLILLSISVFVFAISALISLYKDGIITTRNYKILQNEIDWKNLTIELREKEIDRLIATLNSKDKIQAYLIDSKGIHALTSEQYKRLYEKKEDENADTNTL